MTEKQIQDYEYIKTDIAQLKKWRDTLPFKKQNHGCGSQAPAIEYRLEEIHREMYTRVIDAIGKAFYEMEKLLEEI